MIARLCLLQLIASTQAVSLAWSNLNCTFGSKTILHGVSGTAAEGRMLAIMGPSGSGKTTLLNTLAGQVQFSKKASLTGKLLVDGAAAGGAGGAAGVRQAYVRQEDIFYTQMTVRETLMFAAKLRLPSSVPIEEKREVVDTLLKKLSLVKAADTIVGNSVKRGISGGERKRLSIGCELIGSPNVLFLDEPTSGLDAFQAEQVVRLLKTLAREGCTVVMSIHQPRGTSFKLFDDLLLLSEGQLMYTGPAHRAASYFGRLGHRCPAGISEAEHVVDLVSADYASAATLQASQARIARFAKAAATATATASATTASSAAASTATTAKRGVGGGAVIAGRANVLSQFGMLFRRAWREVARSKAALIIKATQQVMIALIYGGIYSLGDTQASIQDRFGLLSLVAIGAGNLAIASTIRTFPKEKTIVQSDRAKQLYGVGPYFLSKVLAEAPLSALLSALGGVLLYPLVGLQPGAAKFLNFLSSLVLEGFASGGLGLLLGAVAPSTDAALAMFPPLLVLMIIFNGFNITPDATPRALRWIPKVSFIRWCSEGLAVNEFRGLKFSCDRGARGPCTETGEQALERVTMRSSVRKTHLAQSGIIAGCYAGTYHALRRNRPRFMSIVPPKGPMC